MINDYKDHFGSDAEIAINYVQAIPLLA